MNKEDREALEFKSLFGDQRYAKKAWRQLIAESLSGEAAMLPPQVDKNGNQTLETDIDIMAYNNVKARLEAEGKTRKPMQAEVLIECNIIRARFNDAPFNTLLDRTAGKVKEEISLTDNPYEDLTDEELEALKAMRDAKKAEIGNSDEDPRRT